jgi:hypothetical protein
MPETYIKIEMMDACTESWLLFFEDKIDKFIKGYKMKNAYSDYKKYCEEEGATTRSVIRHLVYD